MIDTRQEPTFAGGAQAPAHVPRGRRRSAWPLVALLLLAIAAGAWWLWPHAPQPQPAPVQAAPAQPAVPDVAQPAPVPAGPRYPVPAEPAQALTGEPALLAALEELVGRPAMQRFLQTGNFAQRVVATIDNLGREHAPVSMWPVMPTPGRFMVDEDTGTPHIAVANGARYDSFVAFAASLDAQRVVDLYRRLYPALQQAWRELGMGDRYLNDRVIEVIDLLLATPDPVYAPEVVLTEVKGPYPPARPWTRYEYADRQWESLSSGQKILLRVGADNRQRLKAKLREIRRLLVAGAGSPRR